MAKTETPPDTAADTNTREFLTRDCLTIVTGKNTASDWPDSVYELASYMLDFPVDGRVFPLAEPVCRTALISQRTGFNDYTDSEWEPEETEEWLAARYRRLGETQQIAKCDGSSFREKATELINKLSPKSKKPPRRDQGLLK